MLTKVVEYIYDLSDLQSLNFLVKPKLTFTIDTNYVFLRFSAFDLNQRPSTDISYTLSRVLHEKTFVIYINHLDKTEKLLIDAIPNLTGQIELNFIKQLIFIAFIRQNEEWFKENIPELYDEFVFHYSHLSKY